MSGFCYRFYATFWNSPTVDDEKKKTTICVFNLQELDAIIRLWPKVTHECTV